MSQSELYKNREQVDRLHDLIGADVPRNLLRVGLAEQDTTLAVQPVGDPATEETLATLATQATAQAILDAMATEETLAALAGEDFATEATLASLEGTDFATQATLANVAAALESNGGDALRFTPTAALDVSAATVTVTPDGTLPVEQQTPVLVNSDSPLDVSGATVTTDEATQSADRGGWTATTLAADASVSETMKATGADRLRGRVESSGTYTVTLEWLDGNGTTIFTDEVAAGVAAGTATDVDALAISRDVKVTVTDTSSAEQTLKGVLSLA